MKVKSESEVAQSCPTLSNPMDCSLPGSSVHRIFQAKVLEWGAIAFSTVILPAALNSCWHVCTSFLQCKVYALTQNQVWDAHAVLAQLDCVAFRLLYLVLSILPPTGFLHFPLPMVYRSSLEAQKTNSPNLQKWSLNSAKSLSEAESL